MTETIYRNGLIADLRTKKGRSSRGFICKKCGKPITQGQQYYDVVIGGGGLASLKNPDRTHVECIEAFLEWNYGRGVKV